MDKAGNSHTQERIDLVNRYLTVFPVQTISALLADREFRGKEWIMYLKKKNIPFSIRIPNNTQARTKKGKEVKASALLLLGVAQTCALTDARSVWGESVYLPCFRSRQEHVIIASDRCAHNALVEYQQRWQIERLFQALKGRGFDMEKTHLTKPDRVEKLLVLVSLTFCWCYQIGHEQ